MFDIIFGGIFALTGIFGSIGFICAYMMEGSFIWILSAFIFLLSFCGVGIPFFIKGIRDVVDRRTILEVGDKVRGTIVDYKDGQGWTQNGMPPLDIVVNCYYNGQQRAFIVPTNQYSETKFPIGATVQISIRGTDMLVVPNSVKL
jgi:hypothetical protein